MTRATARGALLASFTREEDVHVHVPESVRSRVWPAATRSSGRWHGSVASLHAVTARRYRNLHVQLPESIARRLHLAAKRDGVPATAVARKAIESWLEEHERAVVCEAVAEYARAMAGTAADLDQQLEAAAAEDLLGEDDGDK